MTRDRIPFALLVLTALVQLAVPVGQILGHEALLTEGAAFRFRTRPVDPYDAFRGRYVALGFEESAASLPEGLEVERGERLHVTLVTDDEGWAHLGAASASPPDGAYLTLRTTSARLADGTVTVRLPFDRFYLEEHDAPRAEALYREHNRRGARDAFVMVRVRDGQAALEELFVGGRPIGEALVTLED